MLRYTTLACGEDTYAYHHSESLSRKGLLDDAWRFVSDNSKHNLPFEQRRRLELPPWPWQGYMLPLTPTLHYSSI